MQPALVLPAGELSHQDDRLVAGRSVEVGERLEVDEGHLAAAAHRPPRRDGRVDAAREERDDAAAHPHRQPGRPIDTLGVEVGAAGHDLHLERLLWMREVDAGAGGFLDEGAQHALQLLRRAGEALIAALHGDAKALERALGRLLQHALADRIDVPRQPLAEREVLQPEDAPQPITQLRPVERRPRLDQDAVRPPLDVAHAQAAHGVADIAA